MLKYRAGIDILHVPYRGSADALNDLLPNTVQMMNEINNIPHVKAGKLHLLNINHSYAPSGLPRHADADRARHAQLRRADLVRDHGRPPARRRRSSTSSTPSASRSPRPTDMQASMRAISAALPIQTPAEIVAYRDADSTRNAEVIKAANIKLE